MSRRRRPSYEWVSQLPSVPAQPMSANLERLLTREEVADAMSVTLRFVTRCVQERRIRYVRVGRMVRIPESAILEYLHHNSVPARESGPKSQRSP